MDYQSRLIGFVLDEPAKKPEVREVEPVDFRAVHQFHPTVFRIAPPVFKNIQGVRG